MHEMPEVVIGRPILVGRWECRRGKTWIELSSHEVHGRASYSFTTSWGAKGCFGFISQRQALERIDNDRNLCSSHLQQVSIAAMAKAA